MLATLQAGRLEKIISCRPTHFLYRLLPEHSARVAGLADWDRHGPRFVLTPTGTVARSGNFDDAPLLLGDVTVPRSVFKTLDHSFTWQRLLERSRDSAPANMDLLIAIVTEAAGFTAHQYPGSSFSFLLERDPTGYIEQNLGAAGISVINLTSIIPDYNIDWSGNKPIGTQYVLSMHDLHPNALQNNLIANYLLKHVFN